MAKITKFEKGRNKGVRACTECGKLTWYSRWRDQAGMCWECYDLSGRINECRDAGRDQEADELEAEMRVRMGKYGEPGKVIP